MKKLIFLIFTAIICVLTSAALINDDDESANFIFCDNSHIENYSVYFLPPDNFSILLNKEIHVYQPLISYLEKHETSPPAFS